MINPISSNFPEKDIVYIKTKISQKANSELKLRISKGYENINLDLVNNVINEILQEMNVI